MLQGEEVKTRIPCFKRGSEKDQDSGGVRRGAQLLPQAHQKKTKKQKKTCRTIHTEHLLNAGRRP